MQGRHHCIDKGNLAASEGPSTGTGFHPVPHYKEFLSACIAHISVREIMIPTGTHTLPCDILARVFTFVCEGGINFGKKLVARDRKQQQIDALNARLEETIATALSLLTESSQFHRVCR